METIQDWADATKRASEAKAEAEQADAMAAAQARFVELFTDGRRDAEQSRPVANGEPDYLLGYIDGLNGLLYELRHPEPDEPDTDDSVDWEDWEACSTPQQSFD